MHLRDFFKELYGAEIVKSVARGHDDGADIIVKVSGERWLISCKKYESRSIPESAEIDPVSLLIEHDCTTFVAFYSPVASSRLARKLEGLAKNKPNFKLKMMDQASIASEIFSLHNARGWLLAFRYFPKSYARITKILVHPLSVFDAEHVKHVDSSSTIPGLGLKIQYANDNELSRNRAAKKLVFIANEAQTDRAYSKIFVARISDFARTFPGSFHRAIWADESELTAENIFPSWDLGLVEKLVRKELFSIADDVCRIWSFWDVRLAKLVMRFARFMRNDDGRAHLNGAIFDVKNEGLREKLENVPREFEGIVRMDEDRLSLGSASKYCPVALKGYLASLIAFSPKNLHPFPAIDEGIYEVSVFMGEQEKLRRIIDLFVNQIKDRRDRDYVCRYSDLRNRCKDAAFLDNDPTFSKFALAQGLSAVKINPTISWVPAGETDSSLLDAWAFSMKSDWRSGDPFI
jgi:hypothetical protein